MLIDYIVKANDMLRGHGANVEDMLQGLRGKYRDALIGRVSG